MIRVLLILVSFSPLAFAQLDDLELQQAKQIIESYTSFDLSDELDKRHASWVCNIYYNKHTKLSGAAGEATSSNGIWQCPVRVGFAGNNTGEYIYISSTTLMVSREGWPSENGQELLEYAIAKLKQEVAASAANK